MTKGSNLQEDITVLNRYASDNRKDTVELKGTINQPEITDIHRILQPATAEHTFFSSSRGAFTKMDYILAHKTRLNIFTRTQVIQNTLSHYNGTKSESNRRQISGKVPK